MEDGTLWPKTLLAKDFKNARIMTVGLTSLALIEVLAKYAVWLLCRSG